MLWMSRMFLRLVSGQPPSLVDLPTGSGKTDIIVIWLIALAWYARDRSNRTPIPRRMVWVVNRRVLVQQVFELAELLNNNLAINDLELDSLRNALLSLCRNPGGDCFKVVQLRGQLLDDREWSLDPTVPQLIIGTVDQIGSRLLFQGYGLGKWSRPLHAALLGVDAWICIDEAHLIPAFALTLRQVRQEALKPLNGIAKQVVAPVFEKLPFWTSELSATPGLPRPNVDNVFSIVEEDQNDDAIADRLLAAQTRQVSLKWIEDSKKLADELVTQAEVAAANWKSVAVFCRTVKIAHRVANSLGKNRAFKGRILTITGRLRGYERDRLTENPVLKRFRRHSENEVQSVGESAFLIGTAAAEVGLDADADAIICDFAPLPTLLQRIGRLDRRGFVSRKSKETGSPPPKMVIVATRPEAQTNGAYLETLRDQVRQLKQGSDLDAQFYAGRAWIEAAESPGIDSTIELATWHIIQPDPDTSIAKPPADWLGNAFSAIASGPVVVPPLTSAVLNRWAATTPQPPRFLPVHPWLYGLLPDSEATPLVGIAFRLEVDLVQNEQDANEDTEALGMAQGVQKALEDFPPLRSELHYFPLAETRKWLASIEAPLKIACHDGETWSIRAKGDVFSANDVLVLPTLLAPESVNALFPELEKEDLATARSDVFAAVSGKSARYRRQVRVSGISANTGFVQSDDWACRFELATKPQPLDFEQPASSDESWRLVRQVSGQVNGISVILSYFRPSRRLQNSQSLKDHQRFAGESATRIANAIAPSSLFLKVLVEQAATSHDSGKAYKKWQQAMGNEDLANPVAKPLIGHPQPTAGYRHEWGSLLRNYKTPPCLPKEWNHEKGEFWLDLWLHTEVAHHGFFRPSMPDTGFELPPNSGGQHSLRLQAIKRFARLQQMLGPWRLAYLEGLLKAVDVEASRETVTENSDET